MAEGSMTADPIIEAVAEKMCARSRVGIAKYGTTLADSPEDIMARLRHLQEELMDGAAYVEWVMRKLAEGRDG